MSTSVYSVTNAFTKIILSGAHGEDVLPDGVELDGELAGEDHEEEESVEDEEGPVVPLLLDQQSNALNLILDVKFLFFSSILHI